MKSELSFLSTLDLEPEQLSFVPGDAEAHSTDYGTEESGGSRPDAVVWPESTADVSTVLAAASDHGVPVTPYAAGTGIEGNAVPTEGGISLDMNRMDAVIDVRPEDFQIDVEAGAIGSTVEDAAAEHGLLLPPFPQSRNVSTVGGMIANDASGTMTVKYGEVRDWVLELEAVLADGSVVKAGTRAAKTSSGYNLKDLFVGSEGTLAVVTRATFRLVPLPKRILGGRAVFPTLDDATAAISETIHAGIDVATIELIDSLTATVANAHTGSDLPDVPMVFLEFHGNHGLDAEIADCQAVFENHGVERFEISEDDDEMAQLWQARRELGHALKTFRSNLTPLTIGDVSVPIGSYSDMVRHVRAVADDLDLLIPCFGHAGDGNVHYGILTDLDDPKHVSRAQEASDRIIGEAIAMGGTCTGEHGIGIGKRRYMLDEHGEATIDAMRRIKDALDPNGTLNPGKIFPEPDDGVQ